MDAALIDAAARNNAEWCDIMCRLHGHGGRFGEDAWTVAHRSPRYYPDAVTLRPLVSPEAILASVDAGPGCSVKDSFGGLDLAPFGFEVAFEARWVVLSSGGHPDRGGSDRRWTQVTDASSLAAWERAWNDGSVPPGMFSPALLRHDEVIVVRASEDDEVVEGAIINRSATVVGISNLFSHGGDLERTWRACLEIVGARFPGVPVVGYESGDALEAACRAGMRAGDPVRIWMKDDDERGAG